MKVLPSLVIVRGHRFGGGAGMIWSSDGLVLTNNHVVGRRKPIIKLNDESEHEARLISRSPEEDLALLKIDASDLKPLEPAPENPRVGELAFAFGHPWGQRNSVTRDRERAPQCKNQPGADAAGHPQ
jgi:S1-C subfamily serine protease